MDDKLSGLTKSPASSRQRTEETPTKTNHGKASTARSAGSNNHDKEIDTSYSVINERVREGDLNISPLEIETAASPNDSISLAPAKPSENSTPTSELRKYRILYHELKRKYTSQNIAIVQVQNERTDLKLKLSKCLEDYEDLKEKYDLLVNENKSCEKNDSSNESLELVLKQHQEIVNEKDSSIKRLHEKVRTMEAKQICCLKPMPDDDEMFWIRPKTSTKKKKKDDSITAMTCEFAECTNYNVDLVKCNVCEKWVCEDCNDIPVAKLKQVINKCKRVFFLCKGCEPNLKSNEQKENPEMINTLKTLFDDKIKDVESRFITILEKKLDEQKLTGKGTENENKQKETYAKVLAVPAEIKRMMKEVKNDEKLEDNETQRRSKNLSWRGLGFILSRSE